MRLLPVAFGLVAALATGSSQLAAQRDSVLAHRWVGTHLGRPLHFEFYADSMLVVNDVRVATYRLTNDSLTAAGDTVVEGRYRLSHGWLLFATPDGVITMAQQSFLARPLTGRWIGPLGTEDGTMVDLRLYRSGVAQWRPLPSGEWIVGEWERTFRVVTFVWGTDEEEVEVVTEVEDEEEAPLDWRALYDPIANALLFEVTVPDAETTILRRRFR